LLLGGGQNALQADHEEISEQVGVNILGSAAHILLLEARYGFTNGGFDFSMGFHVTLGVW